MEGKEKRQQVAEAISGHMGYLWSRWQDEREYEDFADYVDSAKKAIEENGAVFEKLTKRPFRVTYRVDGVLCFMRTTSKIQEHGYYVPSHK